MPAVWLARVLLPSMIVGLPLLGVWLAGRSLEPYLEFPPTPEPWESRSFSWSMFIVGALVVVMVVGPIVIRVITAGRRIPGGASDPAHFPRWGWLGVGGVAIAWILAWNRFSWFAPLQAYTFTPFWIGYIVVVNALTFRRTGHCLVVDRLGAFLILFPLSAIFWWLFEYLNLFAQNWYYVGGGEATGRMTHFLNSSLAFSTVLPAVLSTRDLLASFPRLSAGLRDFLPVTVPVPYLISGTALLAGAAGLVGIGVWPEHLFPAVWVAPLLLAVTLQHLSGANNLFSRLKQGDWRPVWLAALAGMVCGFFWEMWNYYSLSRWEYAIPEVHGLLLFEMPLLGYAGYLPFGALCVAIVDLYLSGWVKLDELTCGKTPKATRR